jgi:hypothetical protein
VSKKAKEDKDRETLCVYSLSSYADLEAYNDDGGPSERHVLPLTNFPGLQKIE